MLSVRHTALLNAVLSLDCVSLSATDNYINFPFLVIFMFSYMSHLCFLLNLICFSFSEIHKTLIFNI